MSQSDTKRFFDDLATNPSMKSEADAQSGLSGIASFAQSKSYDVTEDDLRQLAAQGKDLNEGELENLAAGWGISVGCVVCIST